ncbi:exodeoxyribonuclease III [Thioalkalivibrio denitrificans]|uniref:Exodeoxyribonuclease III n=1 Tax=Thioalkalivibrio denitrificans TaxID=108003 RepID=A0A1V3NEY8_9GAMM|nr:exodeoxyribonuclease III [Thioalkalivibrio denitrificans]OOG23493.1 exodeoxyribonuclease III [Thioalkalivibrio denitrificans]
MKIATWNVNSLKVRLPHVLDWMAANSPDVLALQETKLTDDAFPVEAIAEAGYRCVYSGQKTYNGVAVLAKSEPVDPLTDIEGLDDPQRRILAATVDGVRIINLYVVNGSEVGSEKYAYKLAWMDKVTTWIAGELKRHERLVVLGDFNVAPEDQDVHDPEAWHERILCSTPEREALGKLFALGLSDCFRKFEQPEQSFSWWDYRAAAFRRNMGLRIDLILTSPPMTEACTACTIDVAPRRLERPSDHAPVVAEFVL